MTTEQMDWLDDERAGRHAADKLVPKGRPKAFRPDLRSEPPAFRPAPEGWYTFGTHAAVDVKLEFSSELDEAGDPLWERPLWPEIHTDEEWAQIRDEKNGIRAWGMSGIPEIMFGDPSDEQLAAAQKRSGRNGVLVIPEKMRDYLYGNRVADAEEHTHHTREARDQCAAGDHKYAVLLDDAAEREKIAAHDETEGRPHLAEAIRELIDRPQGEASMIAAAGWCMPSSQVYNFLPTDEEIKMAKRERRKAKKARRRAERRENQVTTMAEEPIEERLRRAWLNGYTDGYSEGFNRAAYQTNWER